MEWGSQLRLNSNDLNSTLVAKLIETDVFSKIWNAHWEDQENPGTLHGHFETQNYRIQKLPVEGHLETWTIEYKNGPYKDT